MIKIEKVLKNLGLSPNEIKVYLTLNDYGSSKASKISERAKLDRSSCYNALKNLLEKGLVSEVLIDEVKWFQAIGPKSLLEYVKIQEEEVRAILPDLHARHKASKITGQVRLFKGANGVRSVFQDILRTETDNIENLVFGNENQLEERMPAYHNQFIRQLKEKKIKVREIVREGRSTETTNPKQTRFVPKSVKSPVVTNIYQGKIALIIWTDEPQGVIIENQAAAEAYRSYFEFMWKHAKK